MDAEETMWADFNSVFNYDRRPAQAIAFEVQPGRHNMPRDVVEAAIAAGKATAIEPPKRAEKPAKDLKKRAANPT